MHERINKAYKTNLVVLAMLLMTALAAFSQDQENRDPMIMLDRLDNSMQKISEGVSQIRNEMSELSTQQTEHSMALSNHETRLQSLEATSQNEIAMLREENKRLTTQMWIDRGIVATGLAAVIVTLMVFR